MFENGTKSQKQALQLNPNNAFQTVVKSREKKARTIVEIFIKGWGLDGFLLLYYSS